MDLCLTLNPCLDKSLVVPPWQPGEHQVRGRQIDQIVGGKGVNVARGLKRLGRDVRPVLLLGGELGKLCERLLRDRDGFDPIITWTVSPTREILTVRTEMTADQTAFFDPNPVIQPSERDALARQMSAALEESCEWCAMSGSSPCLATDDLYAELVMRARGAGARTLVDTYGDCLKLALAASPDIVKVNRRECEQAVDAVLDSAAAVRDALDWIRSFGVSVAAITFGPGGAATSWDHRVRAWQAPSVSEVNPIGAGDAMAAGWMDALSGDCGYEAAFRWAMACAASSVEQWTAADIHRRDVDMMEPRVAECDLEDLAL